MKRQLILFCLLFTQGILWGQSCYELVWSDEFNGTTLNTNDWNIDVGDGCPNLCGWGNNELEYYQNDPDNIYIQDGVLHLNVVKESAGNSFFSSGKINTRNKQNFKYGRFEARMRLPRGFGMWPAFWMLPVNSSWPTTGEIDIMEYRGDRNDHIEGTLHYGPSWPNNQNDGDAYYFPGNDWETAYTDFHVYTVDWDSTSIKWYVDGVVYKTETKTPNTLDPPSGADPWPWDSDFYILLNLAVGGWYSGNPGVNDVQLMKSDLEIDYVRVYNLHQPSASAQTAYNNTPATIPGTIQLEEYDNGCTGIAFLDSDAGNNGGVFRTDNVDIESTTDTDGDYNIGWTNTDEFLTYTVNVTGTADYDLNLRVASGDADGGAIRIEVDGQDVTGSITVNNTGGWQNWVDASLGTVNITQGSHVVKLYITEGGVNLNYLEFTSQQPVTDCNGVSGGQAIIDNCGNCTGGNTGAESNPDADNDGVLDCDDVCEGFDDNANFDNDSYPDGCDDDIDNDNVLNADDCDDNNTAIGLGTIYYVDSDGDGFGQSDNSARFCTAPSSGYSLNSDDNCPNDPDKTQPGDCGCSQTESSCRDCNNEVNGSASIDNCNVCSGGSTGITVDACLTNLDEVNNQFVNVFPNPVESICHIRNGAHKCYRLYDISGMMLEKGYSESIDMRKYNAGIYILKVGEERVRIIKE